MCFSCKLHLSLDIYVKFCGIIGNSFISMVATGITLDRKRLDWNTRMKIAASAAKGLEYLHDKANPPVI